VGFECLILVQEGGLLNGVPDDFLDGATPSREPGYGHDLCPEVVVPGDCAP